MFIFSCCRAFFSCVTTAVILFTADGSVYLATPINVVYVLLALLQQQDEHQVSGMFSLPGTMHIEESLLASRNRWLQ